MSRRGPGAEAHAFQSPRGQQGLGAGHLGQPPPRAASGILGPDGGTLWLWGRAVRITGPCTLSLWRRSPGVRRSSRRSPGRPAATVVVMMVVVRLRGLRRVQQRRGRPAGAKRSRRPGGTTGSCPGTPRPRHLGWSGLPAPLPPLPGPPPPHPHAARRSPEEAGAEAGGEAQGRGAGPGCCSRRISCFSTSS